MPFSQHKSLKLRRHSLISRFFFSKGPSNRRCKRRSQTARYVIHALGEPASSSRRLSPASCKQSPSTRSPFRTSPKPPPSTAPPSTITTPTSTLCSTPPSQAASTSFFTSATSSSTAPAPPPPPQSSSPPATTSPPPTPTLPSAIVKA